MKKVIIGSLLVIGLAAGFAYAHGNNWGNGWNGGHMMGYGMGQGGHMMGPGMMGTGGSYGGYANCPGAAYFGQDGWNSAGHRQYLEDTAALRRELNNKRFEYQEARRSPNSSGDQLASIEKEINAIEQQLREKAQQY